MEIDHLIDFCWFTLAKDFFAREKNQLGLFRNDRIKVSSSTCREENVACQSKSYRRDWCVCGRI